MQKNKSQAPKSLRFMVKFLSEEFSDGNENMFDYSKFYGKDSDYKNNIIRTFSENFLNKTIELISEVLGTEGNVHQFCE